MRTHPLAALSLLLCACPPDAPADPSSTTSDSTGKTSSTVDTAPDVTTGVAEPTTDTGEIGDTEHTSTTDIATSDTGDTTDDTGEAVVCPETLPAPTDCAPLAGLCGGATPLAGGGDMLLRGTALTRDDVWFVGHNHIGCEALYRVSKRGGDAHRVLSLGYVYDFEADDDAVYVSEGVGAPHHVRLSAVVGGVVTVLAEIDGDSPWDTRLIRTDAGVLVYDLTGPPFPTAALLAPTGLTTLPSVAGPSLGTAPTYDGERLFFAWRDPQGPLDRVLVGVDGESSVALAQNVVTIDHNRETVAVDAGHVYFATEDVTKQDGMTPPRGLSRVAKSGGPAEPLIPPTDNHIYQVIVDDTEVYYRQTDHDVFAVAKAGGAPRHIWHGDVGSHDERLHMDADNLYFAVVAPVGDIPFPGEQFIVRVAKDTVIP